MTWQDTPFTMPLITGAVVALAARFFLTRTNRVPGSVAAHILLIACAWWMGTYAAEMASATLPYKLLFAKLQYFGILIVPVAFLAFATAFTGREKRMKQFLVPLVIVCVASWLLVMSNETHHLYWSDSTLLNTGSYALLKNSYGIGFYVWTFCAYTALALATGMVLQLLLRSRQMYATQASALLFAVLLPWIANILYFANLNPFPAIDLTPMAFTISSLALAWGVSGLRIGDIISVSRGVALDSMSDAFLVLDGENRIVHSNVAARILIGKAPAQFIGQPIVTIWPQWPYPVQFAETEMDGKEMSLDIGDDRKTFEVRVSAVTDWRGQPISQVAVIRDITERKRLENELAERYREAQRLADVDPVTGLNNHRAIYRRLDQEIKRTRRTGRPISLIVMDVDGFKLFNDTYGHPVGDDVLREIASVLRQNARAIDILGRYGGDEFVAILPETDTDGALFFAERLKEELSQRPYTAPDSSIIPICMSFGIATYPQDATQVQELVAFADGNLYGSKQMGGNAITTARELDSDGTPKIGHYGVLDGLVTAVDRKDRYTRKHSEEVTDYAMALAEAIGLSEENLRTVRIAGLLHDLGKIGVPDEILRKPGKLDEDEYELLKQHTVFGESLIKEVPNLPDVLDAVGAHHERFDGTGYPRGKAGEEIPLLGRVLAVADAFSAMTSDRPYRRAMTTEDAVAELRRVAGSQLDARLVDIFLKTCLGSMGEVPPQEQMRDAG